MSPEFSQFEQVAKLRQTIKIIAEADFPATDDRDIVDQLINCSGWAPFHKVCNNEHRSGALSGIEPWRFYCLDASECRKLRRRVMDDPNAGKIPGMLASARALVLATWLPNSSSPSVDSEAFEPTIANVEHIAAASAAVQTLLLGATAAGVRNYWSSGGVLRTPRIFEQLGIPLQERLLGAIFLFQGELPSGLVAEVATSKLRAERCPPSAWSRWVKLD